MSCEIHVNDIGTIFRVTVQDCNSTVVDVSMALDKTITLKKPNGTVLTKDAGFYTDGTDGQIQYTAVSGDLDMAGSWKLQAHITTPSGSWSSDFHTFKVARNL
jgi:hypothetical protein